MGFERHELANALGAQTIAGAAGPPIMRVVTDTRADLAGGLFFALQGDRYDAHAFLSQAIAGRAAGVVVSDPAKLPADLPPELLVLGVPDTGLALRALARAVRRRLRAPVVAVTGSVGKTSVKDMAACALSAFGKVGRTPGNLNNLVGLPLALCGLDGDEKFCVLELGMSAPGEIDALCRVAEPEIGVVTRVAAAHLAFFPSLDAIADAKAELFYRLPEEGVAIVNADDPRLLQRARQAGRGWLLTYGQALSAIVRVGSTTLGADGLTVRMECGVHPVTLRLATVGLHHAHNAAAALAVVHAVGRKVTEAAEVLSASWRPGKHRMAVVRTPSGLTVLDDCYNANPASALAALASFAVAAGGAPRRGAVLGSMLELGAEAPALHREVGAAAAKAGVDWLRTTGPHGADLAEGARAAGIAEVRVVDDAEELKDDVAAFAAPDRWLLLKGSRGERLERLLAVLEEDQG
jgi:UDP-N-acetylmuramoyl-tripeptide--D-alanyl-D-alanine ligase